ncbi:MAG: hypothetical protein JWQ72_2751 [Polaromonas sp.]|nr:hypothetical protein [Polaromonas sp.]
MPTPNAVPSARGFSHTFLWSGLLLGIGLSGFFDGILLHQVLQWHHLLSNVRRAPWQDLRMQLMADGLFHMLMYAITVAGLALLWKARRELALDRAGRALFAFTLLGFGAWNVIDVVGFHWVAGIHRIRLDTDDPLLWDLLWLIIFGAAVLALAYAVHRGKGTGGGSGNQGRLAASALGVACLGAGIVAAIGPPAGNDLVVVFKPGVTASQAFNALGTLDARVMWSDAGGSVWAIKLDRPQRADALYGQGALLVTNSALSLGCLSWAKPADL